MKINIDLDKAKYLAQEINQSVYAGGVYATCLNDLIVNSINHEVEFVPLFTSTDAGSTLYNLYCFFNDVGMLDG